MCLELILVALGLDDGIAAGAGVIQLHGFVKQVEVLELLDGARSRLYRVKDDEGLALRLEVLGGADVEDGAIFLEDLAQCVLQRVELDALLQVFDLRGLSEAIRW